MVGKAAVTVLVNWEHLVGDPAHEVFKSHLWKNFSHILGEVGDMEPKWAMFKTSIVEVTGRTYGQKVIGDCSGGKIRTHWWTPAMKKPIKLKREAFWKRKEKEKQV